MGNYRRKWCRKSTLIKGLLKLEKLSGGKVILGEGLQADEIGYLPQQTSVQRDFPVSVWEIVLSGRLNRCGYYPFYRKKDKEDAQEKLEFLGISDLKNRCYRDLSGGQQQRVLLARALCSAGRLLILDEPVTGLDPEMTKEMYLILRRCIETYHMTVIMVSHDIRGVLKEASHILYLDKGRVSFVGTKADYIQENRVPLTERGFIL